MNENFLWQYIDIDEKHINPLKEKYLECLPSNEHFFQPVDIGVTEFMGLEIKRCILIQVAIGAVGRIHTDHRFDKNFGDQLALNIPLMNCEDAITEMWKSDYNPPTQYTDNGQPYNFFDKSRCTKISEFIVNRPVLFRTDIPHSVSNTGKFVRRAISLRFKKDPWHLVSV